ncbi:hypothetical protein ABIF96_008238 [Bradyrhizobium ottawaense]
MLVGTWLASRSGPKSTKKTRPSKSAERRCPTVTATAVFPMPPGPDQGHEAIERQAVRNLLDDLLASDHLRKLGGQGAGRNDFGGGWRDLRGRLSERGDKAIATAGYIEDITGRFSGIAEHLAERCDMEAQTALVDIHLGPDALDQFSLVDDFSGALGKQDENIERAAADVKRLPFLFQEPGLGKQPKWPE